MAIYYHGQYIAGQSPGKSAYQIAIENGYEGTEEEWIQSLDNTFKAGTGITITDKKINIDVPVQGIITQEEYEALSEEQRNKGLYIVDKKIVINGQEVDVTPPEVDLSNYYDKEYIDKTFIPAKFITLAEYEALSEEEKNANIQYIITDDNSSVSIVTPEDLEAAISGIQIPDKLSQFTNDEGFVSESMVDEKLEDFPTTSEVEQKISAASAAIIGGAPQDYDTLKEIYDYISQDEDAKTALNSAIAGKVDKTTMINGKALNNNITLDAEDVNALPDTTTIPSKTSQLTNDSGFLTSYTETDPTVPSWAKAPSKPSYTASEVDALPVDGTAVAANKLATPRSIDGIKFDGTGDAVHFGSCNTYGTEVNKTVDIPNFTLVNGAKVSVLFQYGNTATNPTLNVSNTGAYPIQANSLYRVPIGWLGAQSAVVNLVFYEQSAYTKYWIVEDALSSVVYSSDPDVYGMFTIANYISKIFPKHILNYFNISGYLHYNSWEAIDRASKLGIAPLIWNVGDTIDIQIGSAVQTLADEPESSNSTNTPPTNQTITLQIYGFNHDNLTTGGKAGITFGMKNLMTETNPMNSTSTNVGGFTGSAMYSLLQNNVLASLPTDLQDVIKLVDKKTSAGNKSTVINTDSMKLFLFSAVETGLRTTDAVYKDEGTQYPIFTDNASRIKKLANGASYSTTYWTRSPVPTGSSGFSTNSGSGTATGDTASNSCGVCFGFCI